MITEQRRHYIRRYQVRWLKARREAWLKEHGPCVDCGSWEGLEVDHKDRTVKVGHKVWSWAKSRRDAELAKCQPLCRACHKEKSAGEMRSALKGKPNPKCRLLTTDQVREMRRLTASGYSNGKVAKLFRVARTTVSNIRTRLTYVDV